MNSSKLLLPYILVFSLITFFSCNSVPETTLTKNINPNNCRIAGTIISIEEISEKSGPCSNNPCVATVKINNVIGTGFGFNVPLIKNDTIKIKFEFTLSETSKEMFPALNFQLPGLSIGDKFIGDVEMIEAIQLINSSKPKFHHRIFNYNKID